MAVRRQKMCVYEIFRAFAPWLSVWCKRNEETRVEERKKSVKTVRKDRAEQISMLFQDEEQSHLIVFIHFLSTFHGGL